MESTKKPRIDLLFQVGIVTENLERLLANWKKLFDFDQDSIKISSTKDAFESGDWQGHNYNEKPCVFFNKFARFDLGGIDFEIIEPLDQTGTGPFAEFLKENNGTGLHHIGVKVSNMDALALKMKEMGVPVLNHAEMGPVLSNGVRKGCVFYDLRPQLGMILECCSVVVGPRAGEADAGNPPECVPKKKNNLLFGFKRELSRPALDMVFQVSACVKDSRKTLAAWKEIFDIDEDSIVVKSTKKAFEFDDWDGLNYNEKKCGFFHQYIRFNLGNFDMEIIEPFDKNPGNPYSDFLIRHGNGFHHLGVKVGNLPALMQEMKDMGKPRLNYAEMGPVLADGSRKSCVFYDLVEELGVILECGSVVVGPLSTDPRAGNPEDFISD